MSYFKKHFFNLTCGILTLSTAACADAGESLTSLETKFLEHRHSFVSLSQGRTHYEDTGSGPTIVLIHGVSGPMQVWDKTTERLLAEGYRVIRYDLYGRGLSARLEDAAYDLPLYLTQLEELLSSLSIHTPVTLIGSSFGSIIATEFTLHHPDRVQGVVTVGPAGFPIEISPVAGFGSIPIVGEGLEHLLAQTMIRKQNRRYAYDASLFTDFWPYFDAQLNVAGTSEAMLRTMKNAPVTSYSSSYRALGELPIPVGIIWGKQDQTFPYKHHKKMLAHIPHAQLVAIDNAAHLPQWEKPEETNTALLRMLKRFTATDDRVVPSPRLSLPVPVTHTINTAPIDNADLFSEPFFADAKFKTIQKDLSFAPALKTSKSYLFPTFYAGVTTSVALFAVDAKSAQELLPKDLKLKSLIPGKGILAISSYHYGRVRGMLPYNEVALSLVVDGPGQDSHAFVIAMPVTSQENRQRGHRFWGLPKEVMPITLRQVHSDFVTDLPFLTLRVLMKGAKQHRAQQTTLHSVRNGSLVASKSYASAEIVETKRPLALVGLVPEHEAALTLKSGATADVLRGLKISRTPFQTSFADGVMSAFELPGSSD